MERPSLVGFFVRHKVAANLLMLVMVGAGVLGLMRMNIQFFPTFALDFVTVRVVWSGAAAEDVQQAITQPLEERLRSIENLKTMTSTSAQGVSSITLEFNEDTDPIVALDDARQQVDDFRNLPGDAERPVVTRVARYDQIANVILYGPFTDHELRSLANRLESDLLNRGIDRVEIRGLPTQQISIEVPNARLRGLGMSLDQIADRVAAESRDLPAGQAGELDSARELRAVEQRRAPEEFANLPLQPGDGNYLRLGDVATIRQEAMRNQGQLFYQGFPAVEMVLQRAEDGDSLTSAAVLNTWLDEVDATLPPGLEIHVYDQAWQLINDRIGLLVSNGLSGLILVLLLLYLFLPGRVALWVAVGIPTAFLAALAVFWLIGGSINMISLFALIMALGVIVDDAIVVGEDADAHFRSGEHPSRASEGAANRMLWPVVASSLTTIAAFMPLLMVGGIFGNILGDIPIVMICILIASLLECFIVLPHHLRNAFKPLARQQSNSPSWVRSATGRVGAVRNSFDHWFDGFRQGRFRRFSELSLRNRGATLACALVSVILSVGLISSGRIGFSFFPTPEPQVLNASANFVAGTPRIEVEQFLEHLRQTLNATEAELGGDLIETALVRQGEVTGASGIGRMGDQLGSIMIELVSPDHREVRNQTFIRAWRERIILPAGIERLSITERVAGPPGKEVNIRLTGEDPTRLKEAADALGVMLSSVDGVLSIEDDMAWGREQLIYSLSPYGQALGLSTQSLGRQLRAAYDGRLAQIYQQQSDEIEVRVQLPRAERQQLASLSDLSIRLDDGRFVPLNQVATFSTSQGFEALRHAEGQTAVEVTADLDPTQTTAGVVLETISPALPKLAADYNVRYSFEGRSADQRDTMADMRTGLVIGLLLMYSVLVWVFSSWTTPLIVMAVIPLALVGALLGHWVMGLNMTILSLFGLFGLSGIVVNNSIILVSFFQQQRKLGMAINEALSEAVVQRLRAVLLTSLTTIGGLLPLLFETSLQAQFLIPMATSIAFGLGFSTVLVLLVVPALLSVLEGYKERRLGNRSLETP
ncbi:MAG TPA: efflux RND transporter permease subunit [Pseudomonas xinjiangensis]|uniref:Efflux RND transporter permease subunit n=2 Tax=root TaxID=1 RepID=A0A7V1BLU5_9GAMM|nr:efflux RND transporter permease subunit [Halopseudomonas xinjiangensis]HEC46114.1 efflux RND transporter permease subunit [Halopseudomonas xinjiangensis]